MTAHKDRSALQDELNRLKQSKRRLETVIGELAHEGRRVKDGLERAGGADRELQGRLRALGETIRLNEAEVDRVEARIAVVKKQLAESG